MVTGIFSSINGNLERRLYNWCLLMSTQAAGEGKSPSIAKARGAAVKIMSFNRSSAKSSIEYTDAKGKNNG